MAMIIVSSDSGIVTTIATTANESMRTMPRIISVLVERWASARRALGRVSLADPERALDALDLREVLRIVAFQPLERMGDRDRSVLRMDSSARFLFVRQPFEERDVRAAV